MPLIETSNSVRVSGALMHAFTRESTFRESMMLTSKTFIMRLDGLTASVGAAVNTGCAGSGDGTCGGTVVVGIVGATGGVDVVITVLKDGSGVVWMAWFAN